MKPLTIISISKSDMSRPDQESSEAISVAMRSVKSGDCSELEKFSLSVLEKTVYQLGNRDINSGYRKVITDRISELKTRSDVVDVKPSCCGIGVNLNEVWWRLRRRSAKK